MRLFLQREVKLYAVLAALLLPAACAYIQLPESGLEPAPQPVPAKAAAELVQTEPVQTAIEPLPTVDIPLKEQPDDNVWQRALINFQLDLSPNNRRVRMQRNWYASHQEYLDRVSQRGERYLFHVVTELEKRDMPGELALLPIVESAFDPFAYSHGRASGMWQFIPSTGKRFGLKQNWWYDGRRDVVESTRAALDYLQYLHKRFDNDWLLALGRLQLRRR